MTLAAAPRSRVATTHCGMCELPRLLRVHALRRRTAPCASSPALLRVHASRRRIAPCMATPRPSAFTRHTDALRHVRVFSSRGHLRPPRRLLLEAARLDVHRSSRIGTHVVLCLE